MPRGELVVPPERLLGGALPHDGGLQVVVQVLRKGKREGQGRALEPNLEIVAVSVDD